MVRLVEGRGVMITWQKCKGCDGDGYVWNTTPPGSRGEFRAVMCPDCWGTGGMDSEQDDGVIEDD